MKSKLLDKFVAGNVELERKSLPDARQCLAYMKCSAGICQSDGAQNHLYSFLKLFSQAKAPLGFHTY